MSATHPVNCRLPSASRKVEPAPPLALSLSGSFAPIHAAALSTPSLTCRPRGSTGRWATSVRPRPRGWPPAPRARPPPRAPRPPAVVPSLAGECWGRWPRGWVSGCGAVGARCESMSTALNGEGAKWRITGLTRRREERGARATQKEKPSPPPHRQPVGPPSAPLTALPAVPVLGVSLGLRGHSQCARSPVGCAPCGVT